MLLAIFNTVIETEFIFFEVKKIGGILPLATNSTNNLRHMVFYQFINVP